MIGGALLVIVAAGTVGLAFRGASASRAITALPDYGVLPDFSLTNQHGQPISRAQLAGSVWIADFIFTRCAGQCPLMSEQMGRLQTAFGQTPGPRLVSFSVDPDHDTPEVLATYAKRYGAQASRWQFVTGSNAAVAQLAQQGFHLAFGEGHASVQEPITHSVRFVLIDQQGHIRGYYDATDDRAMITLHDDAWRLLRGVKTS